VTPGADPQQGQLVDCVDGAITKTMSALLHHEAFQSIEAAWRGLEFLVRRLETGTSLKIFLLDWSRQELAADLLGCDDLRRSALYKVVVEQTVETPGSDPWSLLVGNFDFGSREVDALELAQIAQIAAVAGAPFVAAAKGELVGCVAAEPTSDPDDWQSPHRSEAWDALRQFAAASSVALLWPRFLLRLPYGRQTMPVDAFDFEETRDDWSHNSYLWGNPSFVVACVLGQAYSRSGWDMHPRDVPEVGDLPLHIHESEARPCSELLFSDRGLERVLSTGLTPLVAFRGQDAIRLGGLQAINGQPLRGKWS
jgi:type VI secretion system protein ImpC